MKTRTLVAFALLATLQLAAADKPRIHIEVVETQTTEREVPYFIPGTASQTNSSCAGSATAVNLGGGVATANVSSNCTSNTTPGRPSMAGTRSVPQVHVRAIMSDGKHITLWCQPGFRVCPTLNAGHYDAYVDGNSVWIYGRDLGGKEHKAKYRYEGDWQEPARTLTYEKTGEKK